jgi:heme a synthase
MAFGLPAWFLRSFRILVIVVAGLIVLGGSVRVMNAGLACPDWPLCFGNYIPDFHPQVYFEFIHRVVAGSVGIVTLFLQVYLMTRKSVPTRLKVLGGLSLLVLVGQIVLGGLTVLLQLKSGVVASHLAIGTGFFAILLWMSLELKNETAAPQPAIVSYLKNWTTLVLVAVYGQMILGGLVASNYAALACTDFPLCQGSFIPTLAGPVGLHVIHRLGAYTVGLIMLLNLIVLKNSSPALKKSSRMMFAVVILQICLGIANVIFFIPPIIAILHLAVALKLLYLAVKQANIAYNSPEVATSKVQTTRYQTT